MPAGSQMWSSTETRMRSPASMGSAWHGIGYRGDLRAFDRPTKRGTAVPVAHRAVRVVCGTVVTRGGVKDDSRPGEAKAPAARPGLPAFGSEFGRDGRRVGPRGSR